MTFVIMLKCRYKGIPSKFMIFTKLSLYLYLSQDVCCQIALVPNTYDIGDKEGEPADYEDPHHSPQGLGCLGLLGEPELTSMTELNVTVSRFYPRDKFIYLAHNFKIFTRKLEIHVLFTI